MAVYSELFSQAKHSMAYIVNIVNRYNNIGHKQLITLLINAGL